MAKEANAKENPVMEVLRKLKEEETELLTRLKPIQEAISALEKIVDKNVKKTKATNTKESAANAETEEVTQEAVMEIE